MGFVAHYEVPPCIRDLKFCLDVFVAAKFVQPCYDEIVFKKPVSCSRCFEFVVRHDFERKLKAPVQFILPLFGKATRTDDQTTVQVRSDEAWFTDSPNFSITSLRFT